MSDDNKKLSKGVDYIGVNCVFWCHDGRGNVLMHKRSQNCRDEQGKWDCGGGSMDFGETFEQTVRREVAEEYGAKPLKMEYIATKNVLRKHNGNPTHWIKNMFWVLVDPKKVRNMEPEKIDEIGWFTFNKLPSPLHSQIIPEIDMIRKFLKGKAEKPKKKYE